MQFIKVDGVSFNVSLVSKMTAREFIEHDMHQNHYIHLSDENKKKLLSNAYNLIVNTNIKKQD